MEGTFAFVCYLTVKTRNSSPTLCTGGSCAPGVAYASRQPSGSLQVLGKGKGHVQSVISEFFPWPNTPHVQLAGSILFRFGLKVLALALPQNFFCAVFTGCYVCRSVEESFQTRSLSATGVVVVGVSALRPKNSY